MKRYVLFFICLLMAVVATSCKKEKTDDLLKGRMTDFHSQKAIIDAGDYSCFIKDELIQVNNRTCNVSAIENGGRTCNIARAEQSSQYYAFYPADMISRANLSGGFNGVNVSLPRVQKYLVDGNGNQIINNPMAGHLTSSSGIINFNNLCALLKVTVISNWILDSIQVKLNGADIWGTGTIDATNWKIDNMNNGSHDTKYETVSLDFTPDGISTGTTSGKTFYIVVPQSTIVADNQAAISVHIFGRYKQTAVHKNHSLPLNQNTTIDYNTINTLKTFRLEEVGVGVFTVEAAANGNPARKVTFASGNLVRNRSTNEWHFPGKPYHGVSTASYEYYFSYNNNLPSSNDWGWVNTVSGNPPHTWRVPTRAEWIHVLTGNRGNTKNFVYQRVNVTYGLIIFPDNYSGSIPTGAVGETAWNEYDAAGCIFLPAHGYGNSTYDGTQNTHYGYYAMSNSYNTYTNPTSSRYNCFKFQNNAVSNSNGQGVNNVTGLNCDENISGKGGVNVRLVHDLPQY